MTNPHDHLIKFVYNEKGFGDLIYSTGLAKRYSCYARTGSNRFDFVKNVTYLANALPVGNYTIRTAPEIPVDAEADKMVIPHYEGEPWKVRLWVKEGKEWQPTHYLIHPDGGRPGSLGCIVTLNTNAMDLRNFIQALYYQNLETVINVEVSNA